MQTSIENSEAFKRLNPAQHKAVTTIDGPVMVVAGPGTGKTELLALRVAYILENADVAPHNILCLTFTENGALNMRERLVRMIGQDAFRVGIYTFHAFCNTVISRYPEYFYSAITHVQASDLDRAEIVHQIFSELPKTHPFSSFHPERGYTYLKDTLDRITQIKKGGYAPNEYRVMVEQYLDEATKIDEVLCEWPSGRASITRIEEYRSVQRLLSEQGSTTARFLASTLGSAIEKAEEIGKTEPIGSWKKKYTITDEERIYFRDTVNSEKITAVAELYEAYTLALRKHGLYDYDDVIIDVVNALREHATLRSELEEQYQYILIDEFQDTNDAQMQLVRAISSSFVHEQNPNVMVVGDDDQAIYKFQGAELSNIIEFRDSTYRKVQTIVLDTNYRSHSTVLDYARSIVTQGAHRLETRYKDISKVLTQGSTNIPLGKISAITHASDIEEYTTVSETIKKLLEEGTPPEDIAILSREHKALQALLPYLDQRGIPYEYTKKANVFDEPHITEVTALADYCAYVMSDGARKDYLLPSILSYPYFQISRPILFSIALQAKDEHTTWAEVIQKHKDPAVAKVHELLAELSVLAETEPLEHFFEQAMLVTGFKEHHFSAQKLAKGPTEYVRFLASLKTLIEAMREWRRGELLQAKDVQAFIALHQDHHLSLVSESPFLKHTHAISLLTAHAAKGLEFGHVFIIAAHDSVWAKKPRTNKAPLPTVLSDRLTPAGDDEDDFIRLLYVSITRAKHSLYISGHESLVRYLEGAHKSEDTDSANTESGDEITLDTTAHENSLAIVSAPYQVDEMAILKRLVEDYRMPVTHLNNFLNIIDGGPLYFVEQNLLNFPHPKTTPSVFGTAIHKAVAELVLYPKYHGGDPAPLPHILAMCTKEIIHGRLPLTEQKKSVAYGEQVLTAYHKLRADTFLPDDAIEVDMREEGVSIDSAILTGKIDLLRIRERAYDVVDLKTGRSYSSWDEPRQSDADKIKLHKFKIQLIFYKLLLEGSSHYRLPINTLAIEFVESIYKDKELITLPYTPTAEEIARVRKLITAVYHKIVNLDFPDISQYEKNYKGILKFEEDLIA